MKLRVRNKIYLGLAVLFLLWSGVAFADGKGHSLFYHRYMWLLWLGGSVVWLYRSFSLDKPAPEPERPE